MRSHTVYRTFTTSSRREFVRITEDVAGGQPKPLVIKVLGE